MSGRDRGAAVRHAVERMDGTDLILLAKGLADAFDLLKGTDWATDLPAFELKARPALLRAFKLGWNGQGKARRKAEEVTVAVPRE